MAAKQHLKEYDRSKTCAGWTEKESKYASWSVKLMFKDVHEKASLVEQVAIEIDALLSYNNVDHISKEEIMKKAQEIIDIHITHQSFSK